MGATSASCSTVCRWTRSCTPGGSPGQDGRLPPGSSSNKLKSSGWRRGGFCRRGGSCLSSCTSSPALVAPAASAEEVASVPVGRCTTRGRPPSLALVAVVSPRGAPYSACTLPHEWCNAVARAMRTVYCSCLSTERSRYSLRRRAKRLLEVARWNQPPLCNTKKKQSSRKPV